MLAGTHQEREAITTHIRKGLQTEGLLGADFGTIAALKSKGLTLEQKQHGRNYRVGDVIIPTKHHNRLLGHKQYKVESIHGDILRLSSDGKVRELNLRDLNVPLAAEVYLTQSIPLAVGDKLRWTKNNHRLGRINGQEVTVARVEQGQVWLRGDKGRLQVVSLNQRQHLSHNIVGTVYSSQGKTTDRVLVSVGTGEEVSAESLLVAMSRAKYEAKFWCQQRNVLLERVEISNAQRNPSELLLENGIQIEVPPPPQHIDLKHWIERVEGSAIAPDVAAVNVTSISGREVEQRLREERLANVGSGQLYTRAHRVVLDAIAQLSEGGAWNTGGIDATCLPDLKPGERPTLKAWGELKADHPRWDQQKQKVRKYEAPLGVEKGIFLPEVPDRIAWQVYHRHDLTPTPEELESGFWWMVYQHPEIELTIVEGKKKAEALISQGDIAIALPSVTGGYRSKDALGVPLQRRELHPELAVFAGQGRRVHLAFDQDGKLSTIRNVRRDKVRTGELLRLEGCEVDCVQWKPEEGKGPDDLIVNLGAQAWRQALDHAVPLQWDYEQHYRERYLYLKEQVLKKEGDPQDLRMLDVAIAVYAQRPDAVQVIGQSDVIRGLRKKGEIDAARDYMRAIVKEARSLKWKVEQAQRSVKIRH